MTIGVGAIGEFAIGEMLFDAIIPPSPPPTPDTSNAVGGVYVKPARPRPRPIDAFGASEQAHQVTTARGNVGFGIRPEQSSQSGEAIGALSLPSKLDAEQRQTTTVNSWLKLKSRADTTQRRQRVNIAGKMAIQSQIRSAVYPPVAWTYEVRGIAMEDDEFMLEDDEFMSDLEELEDA